MEFRFLIQIVLTGGLVRREGCDYAKHIFPNGNNYKQGSSGIRLAKVDKALFVILNLAL